MISPEKETNPKSTIEPIGSVEILISWLLRVGVVTSLSFVLIGLRLSIIQAIWFL